MLARLIRSIARALDGYRVQRHMYRSRLRAFLYACERATRNH